MKLLSVEEIVADLDRRGEKFLVVSGGEPMLQQKRLLPLLSRLADDGWRIEIETAGVRLPGAGLADVVTQFNVSPKLASSGNQLSRRVNPAALLALQATEKAIWKFVAESSADLHEVARLTADYNLSPIYIMPQGKTSDAVISVAQALSPEILWRGWNLTLRTHVILYGDKRGI